MAGPPKASQSSSQVAARTCDEDQLLRRIHSVRTKDQPPSHSVAARSDPRAWANVIDLRLDDLPAVGPARFIDRIPSTVAVSISRHTVKAFERISPRNGSFP